MTGELMQTGTGTLTAAEQMAQVGAVANQYAARGAFADYRQRRADNTLRRQDADLNLFAEYLAEVGVTVGSLATDADAWAGLTWGIVEGFVRWQLQRGYAVSSVNFRLSTVRVYAKLAMKAGALEPNEYHLIKAVSGFGRKEAKRIDQRRDRTRTGHKKAEPVSLTREQADDLKRQPDTPQGRRDSLLIHLLLDLGLRCGEVAGLLVSDVDLKAGEIRFYRPKVDRIQTHRLTNGLLRAAIAFMQNDALAVGPLLRASRKGGRLTGAGMSERAITKRVRTLGAEIGIEGLSAHDLRHHWATTAARNGTAIDRLQDAGGWSSLAMPLAYVEAAAIANEGVRLE